MASSAASTERADGRNDLATATTSHGHTGTACASCTNVQTCDCPCNVCVLARRRTAGHICLQCDEICGSTQCEDCATPPCHYCGDRGCDGGMYCDAADYDDRDEPCYDCKQLGCPGEDWCPANERDTVNPLESNMVDDENLEMHYAQQEEREEESLRSQPHCRSAEERAYRALLAATSTLSK